jgi:hypothetical protein
MTKYGFEVDNKDVSRNVNRLTNQLWKLIPMREHEENWLGQLNTVILELAGLAEILYCDEKFIILLSKLEGLRKTDIDFMLYRKTVFETMSLLKEIISNECK